MSRMRACHISLVKAAIATLMMVLEYIDIVLMSTTYSSSRLKVCVTVEIHKANKVSIGMSVSCERDGAYNMCIHC